MNRPSKSTKLPQPTALPRPSEEQTVAHGDKIRLMLVDDHIMVIAGLASILGLQPDMVVVAEATDGNEAVDLWRKHSPDVTLLDLRLPKLDGVGVLNAIHSENASARVIVLTTYDSDADIYRAIKAGAKGYLLKDTRREDLLDCIRKVHAGETCIPQTLLKKLATGITSQSMTDRELNVLRLLALGKSNKEIGSELSISEFTAKAHLRSIFSKLNVLSRTEAIAAASRQGLVHF